MSKGDSHLFNGTKGASVIPKENRQNGATSSVKLSDERLGHSSEGDFQQNGRMTGGGHGQENIEKLEREGIDYEILETYPNGVRRGNVSNHADKSKKNGGRQLWFPKDWSRSDIRKAGEAVAKSVNFDEMPEGGSATGIYRGVRVRIYKRNGTIGTVCPDGNQKNIEGGQ